jgi:L-ribulose-5-phosphate 3-epimerase
MICKGLQPKRTGDNVVRKSKVSFNGANVVAQQLGWHLTQGWAQGERAASAYYAPIATFEQRFDDFIRTVAEAKFDTVDIWCAMLSYKWATPPHLAAANRVLDRRGVSVASYSGCFGSTADEFRRSNEVISGIGSSILGGRAALLETDRDTALSILEEFGNVLALENRPEKNTEELTAQIGTDHSGLVGAAVDTGWWATQGFDAAQAIRELGPLLFYVHLKDVRAVGAHDTCVFGDGIVPVADCVTALQEIGYDGAISIEHEPEHYDPFPEVEINRRRLLNIL